MNLYFLLTGLLGMMHIISEKYFCDIIWNVVHHVLVINF